MPASGISLSQFPGYAAIESVVTDRPIYHFKRVESFCYRQHSDICGDTIEDVELVLSEPQAPQNRIGFCFRGVRIHHFSGFGSISGLFIETIEDRRWEKMRFEVGDYENGAILLYCLEIILFRPEDKSAPA